MRTSVDDAPGDVARDHTADRVSRLLAELAAAPSVPVTISEELLRPGDRLDRFEIRAVLGRGGFGTVYEAWDAELGRAVAVKTLRPARARDSRSVGAIKREAEAVAKLNHPGIVTLHDVCESPVGHYLVMERLEGTTLSRRLPAGPLPWMEAVRIGVEIAEALAHAHARGVLHRDLKPANVFLCERGRVKLLDFGLAHLLGSGSSESGGTPAYMAPEQVRGEAVDARADVFALGVVIVEMITGALPFGPGQERGVAAGGAPPLLRVPARLAKLLGRMLARDPGARPADGAEAAAELAAFARSLAVRRRRAWIVGALVACAAGVALTLALQPPRLPAGRLLVAIADLDNRTGDGALDGLGELFGSALEQSRRVSLMDRGTLVRILRRGGRERPRAIGESEAIAAARAASAQLVLVPSIRQAPGGFELAVQVIDIVRNRSIFGARERAVAQESLYEATDRLAVRVRRALAEDASEAPRRVAPVAAFAPAKPEALRLYSEAERHYADGYLRDAKPKWDAALALDPSFPLPRLSLLQASLGPFPLELPLDRETRSEHARVLRGELARLPEGLRPWAETVIVRVEGGYANHTEYLAALDRAIAARPEQPLPYFIAAHELLMVRGDGEAARPYVDRIVQLARGAVPANLTDYLVLTDRLDEARDLVREWAAESPGPLSLMNLCAVHAVRGETAEALAAARRLAQGWGFVCVGAYLEAEEYDELDAAVARAPPQAPHVHPEREIIDVSGIRGRVRDAVRILYEAPAAPGFPEAAAGWPMARGAMLLSRGDRDAVERAVHEVTRVAGPRAYAALLLAEVGNLRLARAFGGPAPDRLLAHRLVRALDEWKTGDPEAALAQLGSITCALSHFHRGEILAELGRHEEAVEAFRRYRRLQNLDVRLHEWALPRSLHLEALSLEALGNRAAALEANARLLRLWASADPDLPLLAEARSLEQRLRTR